MASSTFLSLQSHKTSKYSVDTHLKQEKTQVLSSDSLTTMMTKFNSGYQYTKYERPYLKDCTGNTGHVFQESKNMLIIFLNHLQKSFKVLYMWF